MTKIDSNVSAIRELAPHETDAVSGGFDIQDFGAAIGEGALVGSNALVRTRSPFGAVAGGVIGGINGGVNNIGEQTGWW